VFEQIAWRSPARHFVESRLRLLQIGENKFLRKVASARSNRVMRTSQGVVRDLHQGDVAQIADGGAIPRRLSV
jgi:hypothetical protein